MAKKKEYPIWHPLNPAFDPDNSLGRTLAFVADKKVSVADKDTKGQEQ